jgi:hypothetical protein
MSTGPFRGAAEHPIGHRRPDASAHRARGDEADRLGRATVTPFRDSNFQGSQSMKDEPANDDSFGETDAAYWRRRAAQERETAEHAETLAAANAHRAIAQQYAAGADELRSETTERAGRRPSAAPDPTSEADG